MDFSEAEHLGFIRAFITLSQDRGNSRTLQELQVAAEHLLKGCHEHYRAGVTRISRMHAAVPPDLANNFKRCSMELLDLLPSDVFIDAAVAIVKDFPAIID